MARLLVACEFSGVVRRAFAEKGWEAYSCDLLPSSDNSPYHIQGDVLKELHKGWDMMIAHPPCTYLTVANSRNWAAKAQEQDEAVEFVKKLLDAPINKIALENPIGALSTRIRKPDQIIQPYQFGHNASKSTCLWLKNLPPLTPTRYVAPRLVEQNGKLYKRWNNQTDSGQNRLGPSENRWKERSITYAGIARAMAQQWTV